MIAALYVQTNGAYYGLPDVDPWDEERDARKYPGPSARCNQEARYRILSPCGCVGFQGWWENSTPRIHTPEPFRDLLVCMARSVNRNRKPSANT